MAVDKEVLQIDIAVNTQEAVREILRMERDFQRSVVNVGKAWKHVGKAIIDSNRVAVDAFRKQVKGIRDFVDNSHKARESLRAQTKEYQKYQAEITAHTKLLEKLQDTIKRADKEEREGLQEKIDQEKEHIRLLKTRQSLSLKDAVRAVGTRRSRGVDIRQQRAREARFQRNDKVIQNAREVLSIAGAPIKALFQKDIPGAIRESFNIFQKSIRKAPSIHNLAHAMRMRGQMQGGFGGGMMKMGGGFLGKFGKILDFFGKLEPLFTLLSGSIAGLVKLLIDAEAAAKDFNREILNVASTSEVLFENGRRATMAHQQLRATLKGIRDVSNNLWDNLAWGIDAKEYKAMFNVLTQEGVSIARIQKEAAQARQEVGDFAKDMIHVGVAYSRTFGVALNSIFELQAEMMTEMGYNAKNVEKSFYGMMSAAEEAGIASNKFFAMIRNVSADLSLYNTRLDDAVKLLGKLGTVMSPRNASKFLQTVIQSVKGLGNIGRLQMDLLSGNRMGGDILRRDLERRLRGIAEQLGVSVHDVKTRDIEDLLRSVDQSKRGDLREALITMRTDLAAARKGQYGRAVATRNLSPGATLQAVKDALLRFAGTSSVAEARGKIEFEELAKNQGWSEEFVDGLVKLEYAMEQHRKMLKEQFDNPDIQARLAKVIGAEIKTAADIDKLQIDQLMDTMSEDERKAATGMKEVRDYAKEMADYTSDLNKKLETFMQFVMNQIYNVLDGIYNLLVDALSFFGIGSSAKQKKATADAVYKSGNEDLINLYNAGKSASAFMQTQSGEVLRKVVAEGSWKDFDRAAKISLANTSRADLEKAFASSGLDPRKAVLMYNAFNRGKGVLDASETAGLSKEKTREVIANLLPSLGYDALGKIMSATQGVSVPAGAGAPAPSPALVAQAPANVPMGAQEPKTTVAYGSTPTKTPAKVVEKQTETIGNSLSDIVKALRVQGIKMDQPFLDGPYGNRIEKSVKAATSAALFESFLYSRLNPASFQGKSFDPSTIGSAISSSVRGGMDPSVFVQRMPANAKGGLVLKPAPGEVVASVAPGERILPKGAKDTSEVKVTLELKDDLKRFIRAEAHNAIYEDRLRNRR